MTPYLQKSALFPPQILVPPATDLGLVIVIPAYREEALIESLESLKACTLPTCAVEVIVIINDGEQEDESLRVFHQTLFQKAKAWAKAAQSNRLIFYILYHSQLPKKHAGVGLARKIGMDEAVYRLESSGQKKGIIACFDADSSCRKNYLQAIENYFLQHPQCPAASIHYEHPIEGEAFSPATYQAIIEYELHLRYYIQIQRWLGLPFAYHTVGSSMAVRVDAYQAQGGMNRRKAGEDFYFLHKFIPLGHFGEIRDTAVLPSPRVSDRVPFGTGKSVGDLLREKTTYRTYAPASFIDLRSFLKLLPTCYSSKTATQILPQLLPAIAEYLNSIDFENKLQEIIQNTASEKQFFQRFFRWFNAFQLMKYLHFSRDHFYPDVLVGEAAGWLMREKGWGEGEEYLREILLLYRMKYLAGNGNLGM